MDVVDEVSKQCHNHCNGLDPKDFAQDSKQYCLWRFEDTFLGSCIFYTMKNVKKSHYGVQAMVATRKTYRYRAPYQKHLVVLRLKTSDEIVAAHEFYQGMRITGSEKME